MALTTRLNQDLEREPIRVGVCNGKISYYEKPCLSNKHGENPSTYKSHIFRGVFENKMLVCVRRFERTSILNQEKEKEAINQIFRRDIAVLQEPQHLHENFIRYLCNDEEREFVYLYVATEWCICSVENLYGANRNEKNWAEEKIDSEIIKQSLGKKELLRQATEGLAFLHELGFVHRNLKPSNFLIAQLQQLLGFRYLVKLSDFRLSKNPIQCPEISGTTGSDGWTYPKQPVNTEADTLTYLSGDVFILGCFFHYVLSNGEHPFGGGKIVREKNMNNGNYVVYRNEWNPYFDDNRAADLLKRMIKFNLNDICTLNEVFGFRYFAPLNFYNLYDLPDVKPGLCIIFNQEIFDDVKQNRVGSGLDEMALQNVFLDFGFDVNIYKNLKAKDLCYAISELTKKDFSSYASLIVCILSHGDEGVVAGVDGEKIKINELKYKFNSNDCPTLNGKPKIWIIQACQGRDTQYPIQSNCSEVSGAFSKSDSAEEKDLQQFNYMPVSKKQKKENPTSNLKKEILPQENLNKRPPLMDFLDIRGSISGYKAIRYPKYGSLLIQFLCIELKEEYLTDKAPNKEKKSLEDILKNLQCHIHSQTLNIGENEEKIEVKQTIEWRASLIDRIAFKKAKTRGVLASISIPDQSSGATGWDLNSIYTNLRSTIFSKQQK